MERSIAGGKKLTSSLQKDDGRRINRVGKEKVQS